MCTISNKSILLIRGRNHLTTMHHTQTLSPSLSLPQCLIFLDDPQAVSDILEKLVKEDNLLMAYQICFDLYESASQQFLSSVIQNLRTVGTPIPAVPGSTNTGTVPTLDKDR